MLAGIRSVCTVYIYICGIHRTGHEVYVLPVRIHCELFLSGVVNGCRLLCIVTLPHVAYFVGESICVCVDHKPPDVLFHMWAGLYVCLVTLCYM